MTSEGSGIYRGSGSVDALARSFLNDGQWGHVALRPDGSIIFASATMRTVVGIDPEGIVGTSVLDWLHPDDAERAFVQLTELNVAGSTPGAATFRVKGDDGSYVVVEVLASVLTDGEEELLGVWVRNADYQLMLETLLSQMVAGASRLQLLRACCNGVDWQAVDSRVGIAWSEGARGEIIVVETGLPPELAGADVTAGSPWEVARRTGTAQHGSSGDLAADRRALVSELGLGAYWVEPVSWPGAASPATITIWTAEGPRAPAVHAYGMGVVCNLVELILRWTEQNERLESAARSDSLTGVANYGAFLDALDAAEAGGAVLYCDLDHFKPVNDELGHAAGDDLLRLVARRLRGCVRGGDLVGRIGGDEFAVICPGAGSPEAVEIAERIVWAVEIPFRLDEGREATVSVSVGVATAPLISGELLRAADRALSTAKAGGRGRVEVVLAEEA